MRSQPQKRNGGTRPKTRRCCTRERGAAALLRGRYDKAIAAYDEALSNPENADFVKASIYSDRGVAKWRLKQTKEALDDFNQSIQISPESASVYNNRGNALMDLGHPDEALKDFDRATARSGGSRRETPARPTTGASDQPGSVGPNIHLEMA
jgi:tetratricopeptide (TPR) repeat protein